MGREELALVLGWMYELHEAWKATNQVLIECAGVVGRQSDAFALIVHNNPREAKMGAIEQQLRERLAALNDRGD